MWKFTLAIFLLLFCSVSTSVAQYYGPPPPSAISPGISNNNGDQCTMGFSGGLQTGILGLSTGQTVRDVNCERLKLAKTLYDMGMKVAAVSALCQDERVFQAMWYAGTPCPIDGKIGDDAKNLWIENGVSVDYTANHVVTTEVGNSSNDNKTPAMVAAAILALLFISGS